jgi:hypothetical protein
MVEQRMASKGQDGTEIPIARLVKVEGRPEEVGHVAILD